MTIKCTGLCVFDDDNDGDDDKNVDDNDDDDGDYDYDGGGDDDDDDYAGVNADDAYVKNVGDTDVHDEAVVLLMMTVMGFSSEMTVID
ncbi:unnamed protein product [Enterobius vermicularis]|uniref:Uncharacterized protein n=1 Tax=Enterobius vermicularis TaxID=51028 RepID=A0A0N4UYV8_ENTVE|nr:unnamed protein product [Enterobius vermicularis]